MDSVRPISRPVPPPSGTVAFLFGDVEEFAARLEAQPLETTRALARLIDLVRAAVDVRGGVLFKTVADAFYAAFASAAAAISAARDIQHAVAAEPWPAERFRVRSAVHVGSAEARDGDYFGRPLNRVSRILGVAHGGQILVSAAAAELAADALPDDVELRDLGKHRLKDLESAERLFQLVAPDLPTDFPALRSLQTTPNNLPIHLTRFIGREADLRELRGAFRKTHLLTLFGFGGIGKTRLALQLAAESLDRFPDGAWFVDLYPIGDPDVVADEAARAIGITAPRGQTSTQAIVAALRDKEALLVFDGCEHVLQACAHALDAILRACPNVRAIATSREALGIAGETIYGVDAFDVPPATVRSAREAAAYPAVQLFVERANAVSNGFTLTDDNASVIASICRRLEGIALALELAAAKTSVLTPRQLTERLGERLRVLSAGRRAVIPRQQTLRALIDWSYDLLDETERVVFRRLCGFAGSWTLDAASFVCADDAIDGWRVFETASALVAKSLVVTDAGGDTQRFHLLDSIREYGREKSIEAGEAERVSARAAQYYADFLAKLEPLAAAYDEDAWRAAVLPEIDNVRSAIDWTLVRGHDPQLGRRLLVRFDWPQSVTTPREAIRWCDLAVAFDEPFASPDDEARLYRHYARLAWLDGRPIEWREEKARRGLALARRTDDPVAVALALKHLGGTFLDSGRHVEADAVFAEALATTGLPEKIGTSILVDRAINDLERGELTLARERFGTVVAREKVGSIGHGAALLNLAELEFATGDFEAARVSGRRAQEILGRLRAAPLALLACNRAAYEMAVDSMREARSCLREALERSRESGDAWIVTALEHHAVYCGLSGELERALRLLGYTDARVRHGGATRKRTERYGFERLEALLVAAFGEADLRRRLEDGANLAHEQALALAAEMHDASVAS
jgi:predicted ATPase/class 3 adenylate cyclase